MYSFNRLWRFNWLAGRSGTSHHAPGATCRCIYKSSGELSNITCIWNFSFAPWARPVSCQRGNTKNPTQTNQCSCCFPRNDYIYIYQHWELRSLHSGKCHATTCKSRWVGCLPQGAYSFVCHPPGFESTHIGIKSHCVYNTSHNIGTVTRIIYFAASY